MSISNKHLYVAAGLGLAGLGAAVALRRSYLYSIPERWMGLRTLHPDVQQQFARLFHLIEEKGWRVVLTSAHRPEDTKLAYHFFGLATDINLVRGDTWLKMASPKSAWENSGIPALIRAAGFRWGGDFTDYDPVHVDLGTVFPIAGLRAQLAGQPASNRDGRKVYLG